MHPGLASIYTQDSCRTLAERGEVDVCVDAVGGGGREVDLGYTELLYSGGLSN